MGRYIPILLQEDLNGPCTTMCRLLKIMPVSPGGVTYGVTDLDRAVTYNDGLVTLRYSAAIGMQPTTIEFGADGAVDNAESTSLMPEYDVPISEADIRAGVYDFAEFAIYLVNYDDLSHGHVTLQEGTIGQVSIDANGLSFVNELRGLMAQLKQSVCEKDSLTCRAIFGSQPLGTGGGVVEQRFPCGFDASTLWEPATVTDVGVENTVSFQVDPSGDPNWAADSLNPGMVKWVTGLNAGRSCEVETNAVDGWVTLRFDAAFPIAIGDTLEYRPDCNKLARDESKGCKFWFAAEWVNHFRGEPDIPIGDAGSIEFPGASAPPGQGGVTYEPLEEPEA